MTVFLSTLNQMGFLFVLIVAGFLITKFKVISSSASSLLSKLENNLFIPCLVLSTFISNFTVEKLSVAGSFFVVGAVVILITAPLAIVLARVCSKDRYIRNIYTYGLAFSNFGFMGNAVVKALFPKIFMEYLIFVLPFWILIYVWGVPELLVPSDKEIRTVKDRFKSLVNPMFIAMLIGMIIGLSGLKIPDFLSGAIGTLGDCMSPIAMLITGITIAKIDLKKAIKNVSVYIVSVIRLLVIPIVAILVLMLIPTDNSLAMCVVCSLAMPLGLNTIVVPSAYGSDTTVAAGMALISHILSCATIPLIFTLFEQLL